MPETNEKSIRKAISRTEGVGLSQVSKHGATYVVSFGKSDARADVNYQICHKTDATLWVNGVNLCKVKL